MNLSRPIRFLAAFLIPALLINSTAFAAGKAIDPAAMKAKVQARGVGQGVRVTLLDKTEAKGLIVNIGERAVTVKAKDTDQPREIEYAQITGVHSDHLSTGQKVTIVVVIAGAAIAIIAAVFVHDFHNGFKQLKV